MPLSRTRGNIESALCSSVHAPPRILYPILPHARSPIPTHTRPSLAQDLDLVIGNFEEANELYVNDGYGTFSLDASTSITAQGLTATMALAWGDLDGDGDVDLVVGNRRPHVNELHLNQVYVVGGGAP